MITGKNRANAILLGVITATMMGLSATALAAADETNPSGNNISAGAFIVSGIAGTGFGVQVDYSLASQTNMPIEIRGSYASMSGVLLSKTIIGGAALYNMPFSDRLTSYVGIGFFSSDLTTKIPGSTTPALSQSGIGFVSGVKYAISSNLIADVQFSNLIDGIGAGVDYKF